MGESVTVNLTRANYNQPMFEIGQNIKMGINSFFIAAQRIKNKKMVHRLLKKEYYPYLKVVNVFNDTDSTTFTVKPYNF